MHDACTMVYAGCTGAFGCSNGASVTDAFSCCSTDYCNVYETTTTTKETTTTPSVHVVQVGDSPTTTTTTREQTFLHMIQMRNSDANSASSPAHHRATTGIAIAIASVAGSAAMV